jgi:hypothetical protein
VKKRRADGQFEVMFTYQSEIYGEDIGDNAILPVEEAMDIFPDELQEHILTFEGMTYGHEKYSDILQWAKKRKEAQEAQSAEKEPKSRNINKTTRYVDSTKIFAKQNQSIR